MAPIGGCLRRLQQVAAADLMALTGGHRLPVVQRADLRGICHHRISPQRRHLRQRRLLRNQRRRKPRSPNRNQNQNQSPSPRVRILSCLAIRNLRRKSRNRRLNRKPQLRPTMLRRNRNPRPLRLRPRNLRLHPNRLPYRNPRHRRLRQNRRHLPKLLRRPRLRRKPNRFQRRHQHLPRRQTRLPVWLASGAMGLHQNLRPRRRGQRHLL